MKNIDKITQENFNESFNIEDILTDSVFYPASGIDGKDIECLSNNQIVRHKCMTNNKYSMKTKQIILIIFSVITSIAFANDSTATKNIKLSLENKEIVLEIKNLSTLKSLDSNNGPLIIAICALFGALVTTLVTSYVNSKNTEKTLSANRQNEINKKELERQYNSKIFLKENVAKFIKKATLLNSYLNHIIYQDLENGDIELARAGYTNTLQIRDEIKDIYYSVKVSLDGSIKQRELESILDEYMNVTCFDFRLEATTTTMYAQPIGRLFHKVRAIIHDNYIELN